MKTRAVLLGLALAVTALSFSYSALPLQSAGLEPGDSSFETEGTLAILYYTSRDNTLNLKLDLEIDDPELDTAYDFDVECRVYTNPADPAKRVLLESKRLTITGSEDGTATAPVTLELEAPLPRAHILAWYVYDYQAVE
jgi:hypothetical protein